MDSQTLAPEHIHPTSLYKDREEPYGQFVGINYSEDQKWYFLEKQRPDEVTVMKMWDNREDVARCAYYLPRILEIPNGMILIEISMRPFCIRTPTS